MYLPHRCVAMSSALTTENTASSIVARIRFREDLFAEPLLAMNYSVFQASCQIFLDHQLFNSLQNDKAIS
jgi:hypothetical protein